VTVSHPVLRSVEPGEDWSWCVIDQVMFVLRPSPEQAEAVRPRPA
jgi:hypothetical protein